MNEELSLTEIFDLELFDVCSSFHKEISYYGSSPPDYYGTTNDDKGTGYMGWIVSDDGYGGGPTYENSPELTR